MLYILTLPVRLPALPIQMQPTARAAMLLLVSGKVIWQYSPYSHLKSRAKSSLAPLNFSCGLVGSTLVVLRYTPDTAHDTCPW
jgi:hypothetical protein